MGERTDEEDPKLLPKHRLIICIGDIHGHFSKLQNLWSRLQFSIDPPSFETALVIFLGDYCDRGPQTCEVIDFLIALPGRYPDQTHVFLCGNHDLAFAAFVGALHAPPDGSPFSATWAEYVVNEEREGWFKGAGYEGMHVQGRMWGGSVKERFDSKGVEFLGSVYDASPTFESYGVPHGSPDLTNAVPEEHKKFLANLVWLHEEDNVWIESSEGRHCCELVAVHAGLDKTKGVEEQLKVLKARDTVCRNWPGSVGGKMFGKCQQSS